VKLIGYAESIDTISWTKIPGAVLDVGEESDDWDVALLGFPTVIHRSGQYLMWYQGQDKSNLIRIGFATSNDGVNWVKYAGNPVLDLGEVGAWDSRVVQAPSVVYDSNDEMYKMWFTGGDGEYFQTGYATSPDGRNWTKSDSNPVVQVGVSGAWDSKRVVFARVHYFDGKYSMWYSGEDIDNMYSYEIGYATAIDEENWAKSPENPILSYTGDGSFDSYMVYAADVIELSDGFAMYYSGAAQSVGPYRIGIAKNDVPSASILAPSADSVFRSGDKIDFSVYAFDSGGSEGLMVRYYSDIDGYLGSAKTDYEGFALFSDRHLSVGIHSITIHVSGSGGIGKYLTAEIAVYD